MASITAKINASTGSGPKKVSVTLPSGTSLQNSSLSLKLLGDVDVTSLGSATSISITDGTSTLAMVTTTGIQTFGPYADGVSVTIDIANEQDASCSISSSALVSGCPPANDNL